MGSGGEVKRAMENGRERRAIENGGERMRRFASEIVMCSTCSGFVFRKKHTAMDPDERVVEVVTEAEKMRALMRAVSLDGPLQEKEPAEATKEQWQVLRRRRLIMMETKRCPACSRSLSEKPWPLEEDEEDKAAGSKEEKTSSMEKVSELIFPSLGGEERKKITTEDEAMVANLRSGKKSKRREGKRSSRGLKEIKAESEDKDGSTGLKKENKAESEDKDGSGSKKAKRSSKTEGSGSKEAETEHTESREDAKMEVSESAGGNGKTKMVTRRMDKKSIDILKSLPPVKPFTFSTCDPLMQCILASQIAQYQIDCEFHEYLRRQALIKGYAEYQLEVTDDEDE